MPSTLEVLFTPAEFKVLPEKDLRQTVCVVFDVLRATSTMMTALANGAKHIIPVAEIEEAVALRRRDPGIVLGGERDGVRIRASQSSGVDFDLGNSPREYTRQVVGGKVIAITTTNGTRALRACASARKTLIGSFLGLGALVNWVRQQRPENLLIIGAGTHSEASYEDTLAAGALCDAAWDCYVAGHVADSATIARQVFRTADSNLLQAMQLARNGRRLLAYPELKDDVAFCLQENAVSFLAEMSPAGLVQRLESH